MPTNTWEGAGAGTVTDWNTADNWSEGTVPDLEDDVVIPDVDNNPVMGAGLNPTINSLAITSGGHFTAGNNTITIDGKNASGYRMSNGGGTFVHSNSTILIAGTPSDGEINGFVEANQLFNLTINDSGRTLMMSGALWLAGDLTITAGTLNTHVANLTLIVAGKLSVAGTLTGNASPITTGNVRFENNSTITHAGTWTVTGPNNSGWLWYNLDGDSSNWNPSAGTVHFSHGSNLSGQHIQESKFFNLTLTAGASGHDVAWRDSHSNLLTIGGVLTIEEGQLKRNDNADTLTVTGAVSVESGGILGRLEATGANKSKVYKDRIKYYNS
jgi:hypothetical protein